MFDACENLTDAPCEPTRWTSRRWSMQAGAY